MYQLYKHRAEFLLVVISEAGHSLEGLEFLLETPEGPEQRRHQVAKAVRSMNVSIPAVVDVDGKVEAAYSAWPKRLLVVTAHGQVALDARLRSQADLSDVAQLRSWLESNLAAAW